MDWNKSKTILILAFVIVNIFLFLVIFGYSIGDNYEAVNEEFIQTVINQLKKKNITIQCQVPTVLYSLPLLEVEYKTVITDDIMVSNFLGNNFEVKQELLNYENLKGETLEILNNKQISYIIRDPVFTTVFEESILQEQLNTFIKEKNLSLEGYQKSLEYKNSGTYIMLFNKKFNDFYIENIYMKMYFDCNGVYKFEMQEAKNINASEGKIKVTSAPESLLRLLVDDTIKNKKIIEINMCFFTEESDGWERVVKTNADPTWKVLFDDGTYQYLVEKD